MNASPNPIRVAIIDDHPMLREGVKFVIEAKGEAIVVAETDDGLEGLRLCREHKPDVVMVDLQMPLMEGLDFIKHYARDFPSCPAIVFSTYSRMVDIDQAIECGAKGYLLKDSPSDMIEEAIREVASGKKYFPAEIMSKLQGVDTKDELTPREKEILVLLQEGLSNKDISSRLGIASGTVKIHLCSVFRKLRVNSRVQAVVEAQNRGLIKLSQ